MDSGARVMCSSPRGGSGWVGRDAGPAGGVCAGAVLCGGAGVRVGDGVCVGFVVDGVVELLRGHHSGSWDRRRWKSGSWWA